MCMGPAPTASPSRNPVTVVLQMRRVGVLAAHLGASGPLLQQAQAEQRQPASERSVQGLPPNAKLLLVQVVFR